MTEQAAELIASRNLIAAGDEFTWSTDPRLTGASAVKLTRGQVDTVLASLTMPVLLLLASSAARRHPEVEQWAQQGIDRLQTGHVDGGHHFHMEEGVGDVAQRIATFLASAVEEEVA